MSEYICEVDSFVTRLVTRHITVYALSEDEASEKAIEKYKNIEASIASSVDTGSPRINLIEEGEE